MIELESRSVPYQEIPGLEHVYLEDSFVFGLSETASEISFLLELVLTANHERYARPKPCEQHCYCAARLVFPNLRATLWWERNFLPFLAANSDFDYGNIDRMSLQDDAYHLAGEWGSVEIVSDPPRIVFEGN